MYPEYIRRKGIVIKNPVSVETVEYRPDSKKIVSVGRLNAQKNYPMLLKAIERCDVVYRVKDGKIEKTDVVRN